MAFGIDKGSEIPSYLKLRFRWQVSSNMAQCVMRVNCKFVLKKNLIPKIRFELKCFCTARETNPLVIKDQSRITFKQFYANVWV